MANVAGKVFRVVGPVVEIEASSNLRMLDMVAVGEQRLIGEVVHLKGEYAYVQVYEDTTSLKAGDFVYTEGYPLYVELAPGLLGNIYDGIQRPLEVIRDKEGSYISRGVGVSPLDMHRNGISNHYALSVSRRYRALFWVRSRRRLLSAIRYLCLPISAARLNG